MRAQVVKNLRARFEAYNEFAKTLNDDALNTPLDVPKHKTLAEHLWCVVGARESYARAITHGAWQGFACSMAGFSLQDFATKLDDSAQAVLSTIDGVDDWTPARDELLATLAEHEVMHEGQIIRHVYGMGGELPSSWKWA